MRWSSVRVLDKMDLNSGGSGPTWVHLGRSGHSYGLSGPNLNPCLESEIHNRPNMDVGFKPTDTF